MEYLKMINISDLEINCFEDTRTGNTLQEVAHSKCPFHWKGLILRFRLNGPGCTSWNISHHLYTLLNTTLRLRDLLTDLVNNHTLKWLGYRANKGGWLLYWSSPSKHDAQRACLQFRVAYVRRSILSPVQKIALHFGCMSYLKGPKSGITERKITHALFHMEWTQIYFFLMGILAMLTKYIVFLNHSVGKRKYVWIKWVDLKIDSLVTCLPK